ncbi:hypothetical protein [Novosphingobium mangrovi (ex Hu et al. 2023)]|uniref:DUF3108 domain-containing protein n=1 Tax=Novosphingobium mangrovi (ex Hu et al. 2023) TaxID=2930094 RepID=A0ABT0AFA1_9SPHN|nr:hypothetical protein [Novosphingobium mangrovi (ex Hu et al. 2023)]MCJ1961834.1 hypothetical protein [Novosphingobium mangrovi (ex Hu et al. 2023)]
MNSPASTPAGSASAAFAPLPRRRGRINYRKVDETAPWGFEDWDITLGADGMRTLTSHCELAIAGDIVVRDSVISVHADFHPCEAYVRIMNKGLLTGSGWFRFTDTEAHCESYSQDLGRVSQTIEIQRPMRGFGLHAVQSDGWLAATFPFEKGVGHVEFKGRNLMHSLHHLGATGPSLATTTSGFEFMGVEEVTVPAGTFECNRVRLRGIVNDHPPYDMWLSRDADRLYIKGEAQGYLASVFELVDLDGAPLGDA